MIRKRTPIHFSLIPFLVGLAIWATSTGASTGLSETQQIFWANLTKLCGQSYSGELTEFDPVADASWAKEGMVIHASQCTDDTIHIALHVGENRSRTWVITQNDSDLSLKHWHRHADGHEDVVSWYGGRTQDEGRGWRQAFPADAYSQAIFYAQDLTPSVSNIWYLEIRPDQQLAYGLTRPNRHFRVEFDLTTPVETPPPAWGEQ